MNVRDPDPPQPEALSTKPGELRAAIVGAGEHIWHWNGGDLFLYDGGFLSVPTTGREVRAGRNTTARTTGERMDAYGRLRSAVGELLFDDLVARPGSRLFDWDQVNRARLKRGMCLATLELWMTDGQRLRWVWMPGDGWRRQLSPNARLSEVRNALDTALGPKIGFE